MKHVTSDGYQFSLEVIDSQGDVLPEIASADGMHYIAAREGERFSVRTTNNLALPFAVCLYMDSEFVTGEWKFPLDGGLTTIDFHGMWVNTSEQKAFRFVKPSMTDALASASASSGLGMITAVFEIVQPYQCLGDVCNNCMNVTPFHRDKVAPSIKNPDGSVSAPALAIEAAEVLSPAMGPAWVQPMHAAATSTTPLASLSLRADTTEGLRQKGLIPSHAQIHDSGPVALGPEVSSAADTALQVAAQLPADHKTADVASCATVDIPALACRKLFSGEELEVPAVQQDDETVAGQGVVEAGCEVGEDAGLADGPGAAIVALAAPAADAEVAEQVGDGAAGGAGTATCPATDPGAAIVAVVVAEDAVGDAGEAASGSLAAEGDHASKAASGALVEAQNAGAKSGDAASDPPVQEGEHKATGASDELDNNLDNQVVEVPPALGEAGHEVAQPAEAQDLTETKETDVVETKGLSLNVSCPTELETMDPATAEPTAAAITPAAADLESPSAPVSPKKRPAESDPSEGLANSAMHEDTEKIQGKRPRFKDLPALASEV